VARARLIVAGILVVLGLALLANQWGSTRIRDAADVTLEELRALRGRPEAVAPHILVDWDKRLYRARSRSAFYTADPRTVTSVPTPAALASRTSELMGRLVRLESVPPARQWFFESKLHAVTHRKDPSATCLFLPVDGTNGAVWIVSERLTNRADPKGNVFVARPTHTGKVVPLADVYDGPLLPEMYARSDGHAPAAVALDTEEPLSASEPVDTWAPLTGGSGDVWAVFDGTPGAPTAMAGVAEHIADPALAQAAARAYGVDHKGRTVIWVGDVDTYRARHTHEGRVSWFGLIVALLGVVMLIGHVVLGRG
jgi:hypothetical protein